MDSNVAFNKAFYKATHNSYAGGSRGPIQEQLDQGVRLIELDIFYVAGPDGATFLLGHDRPGDGVYHGDTNPDDNDLTTWLKLVAAWLKANPKAAPVTLVLDSKSDLAGNAAGYDALDNVVQECLGGALYQAAELSGGAWPTVAALSGRAVAVLSGGAATRNGYEGKVLFVESQYDASAPSEGDVDGAWFWAAAASKPADATWAMGGLAQGKLVRLWGFSKENVSEVVSFAATDTPYETWYQDYASTIGAFDTATQPPKVQPTMSWGKSVRYDNGTSPCVAANNMRVAVEVHKSQNEDTLWYHVGIIDAPNKTISWGPSRQYDHGVSPAVAIDDAGNVVEVHKSQNEDTLWYHVGTVDLVNRSVTFGPSTKYDNGVSPSVALDRLGNVVEVHKSQNEDTLWYHLGRLDPKKRTVSFGQSTKYDKGVSPSVTLDDNGVVVEVHKSQNEDTLWYHLGRLDAKKLTVSFGRSTKYDEGTSPRVAMHRDGYLLEVHKSQNEDTLWYHLGTMDTDGTSIEWQASKKYDRGLSPAPALTDDGVAIEVHKSQDENTLWYHVGEVVR